MLQVKEGCGSSLHSQVDIAAVAAAPEVEAQVAAGNLQRKLAGAADRMRVELGGG